MDTGSIVDISNVQNDGKETSNDVRTTAGADSDRGGSNNPGERMSPLSANRPDTDTEHDNGNQLVLAIPRDPTQVPLISNGHDNFTVGDGNVSEPLEIELSNLENEGEADEVSSSAVSNVSTGPVNQDIAINCSHMSIDGKSTCIDCPNNCSSTSCESNHEPLVEAFALTNSTHDSVTGCRIVSNGSWSVEFERFSDEETDTDTNGGNVDGGGDILKIDPFTRLEQFLIKNDGRVDEASYPVASNEFSK